MNPVLLVAVPFLAGVEGFSSVVYWDVKGYAIGYGFHTLSDGTAVTANTPAMMPEEGMRELNLIAAGYLRVITPFICAPVTVNQAAACLSFAYNEGTYAFHTSTLLERINQKLYTEAADQFPAWVYSGGHVNQTLVARRAKERALFLTPGPQATLS